MILDGVQTPLYVNKPRNFSCRTPDDDVTKLELMIYPCRSLTLIESIKGRREVKAIVQSIELSDITTFPHSVKLPNGSATGVLSHIPGKEIAVTLTPTTRHNGCRILCTAWKESESCVSGRNPHRQRAV